MLIKKLEIKNRLGLHLRAATLFVQTAMKFKSSIHVIKGNQEVSGKSLLGLTSLAAAQGSTIEVITDGEDEAELMNAIEKLINNKFYEE